MLLNGTGPLDASTHAALENYKVFIRDQDTKMKVTEDTAKCKSVCFPQYNFSYLEPPFKFNSFSESLKKKKLELKIKNFF